MHSKGFSLIFLVLAVSAFVVAGGVGYALHAGYFGSDTLSDEDLRELEEISQTEEMLEWQGLTDAAKNGKITPELEAKIKDTVKQGDKENKEKSDRQLKKEPCDATLEDVKDALELAAAAQLLNQPRRAELLVKWAQDAFRTVIPDAYNAVSSTIDDDLLDQAIEDKISFHTGAKIVNNDKSNTKERLTLYQIATLLDMREILYSAVTAGEVLLQPACIQHWDIKVETTFENVQEFGEEEKWTSTAQYKDVPIYMWDKNLRIPPMNETHTSTGPITSSSFSYNDGSDWITGTLTGGIDWQLQLVQSDTEDVWKTPIIFSHMQDYSEDSNVKLTWSKDSLAGTGPFPYTIPEEATVDELEIPIRKFWHRKGLYYEDNEKTNFGTTSIKFSFTPTDRVPIDEFRKNQ